MRIAYFIRCLSGGGAEKVAAQLIDVWSSMGHEVVALTRLPAERDEFACRCAGRDVQSNWTRHDFDVAVFNGNFNDDRFEGLFESVKASGARTVVIVHHICTNWLYTLVNHQDFESERFLRRADAVVNVSPINALWWLHRGCRSVYIQNPSAMDFAGGAAYLPSRRLVWVGRTSDHCKRLERMIEAFNRVAEKDAAATLKVLGSCTESARRRFMRRFSANARPRVEIVGFTPHPDQILRTAGLHCFTSNNEVTIPQVVLEAQALAIPTVAYDIPYLGRLGEGDGIIKIPEDADMGEAILELLGDTDRLRTLSAKAVRSFERRGKGEELREKWGSLFRALERGEDVNAMPVFDDFKTAEVCDDLMEELHHAQRHFIDHYLPELKAFRRIKMRLNPRYLAGRAIARVLSLFKNKKKEG